MNEQNQKKIENAVRDILDAIGEDTNREGLLETPERVARMYAEIFSSVGAEKDFTDAKMFSSDNADDVVILKDIKFHSMCEHHLLPFYGKVAVAYIPTDQKVIGLSKIPRIVDFCSKKPQVQENLTIQIAQMIAEKTGASGVAVAIEADHMCINMRGIKASGSSTYTRHFTGEFKENAELRNEFLTEIK
ncbi:MAG: GTP cyclohydrolase I FolE [Lactobacillales bacterium]|jgi:GTP cyclohydrolase I|nr:GTP cyclohydrolase I FolE [Lactobacillales bacterium]